MFGRSKERSFLLLLLSMIAVAFLMYWDSALSGSSRLSPLIGGGVLLAQLVALGWLIRAEDHNVASRVGEAAAAAPFALMFVWAKLG
jgi:hypothetical protein